MHIASIARAVALTATLAAAPLALAQTGTSTPAIPAAPAPSPSRVLPPGFAPVPGGEARAEAVDANMLVILAYAGFFLGMFGYVIHIVRRQAALSRDIQELSAKLEKRP